MTPSCAGTSPHRMGLLRLFRDKDDIVDFVMLHYHGGASG
jgi:hypothetical protein